MEKSLKAQKSFKAKLGASVEFVLSISDVQVGKKFESWDSYSFLLITNKDKKYVAKIYRFPDWPPPGKLKTISEILTKHAVPHENIIYIDYQHETFVHGWQLSEFIEGGTAKESLDNGNVQPNEYYKKVGTILNDVHDINLDRFGSIHNQEESYATYQEMVKKEVLDTDFTSVKSTYQQYLPHIQNTREMINSLITDKKHEFTPVLTHDDVSTRNVMWNNGSPILIDWVDAIAAPAMSDFAAMTFRKDKPILTYIEEGYGKKIPHDELRLHQLCRFLKLGHYYYFEDQDYEEFEVMMKRTKTLLSQDQPFGV